jgi:hypothetical protein
VEEQTVFIIHEIVVHASMHVRSSFASAVTNAFKVLSFAA